MIALFIDESGSFECKNGLKDTKGQQLKEVIGGVLFKNITERELNHISEVVKNEFISVCGNEYYNEIHGNKRKGIFQKKILDQVFKNNSINNKMIPFYIKKGKIDKELKSNITDDNMAAMLYYNMLNEVISTIILYNSEVVNNKPEDIRIFIASRKYSLNNITEQSKKQFENLSGISSHGSESYIKMQSPTSVLIHLNNELSAINYIKHKINITIEEHSIEYNNSENCYNELFQLSDFICNNAYFDIHISDKSLIVAYDNINSIYKKIYKNYKENNLYNFIKYKFIFETEYLSSSYKKIYRKYLDKLDVLNIIEPRKLKDCIVNLEKIIRLKNYSRIKIKYYLDWLEKYIDELESKHNILKLRFYYIKLSVYNHLGNFTASIETYEKVMKIVNSVNSIEVLQMKFKISAIYSGTCANEFNFNKAIDIIDNLIIFEGMLQELIKDSDKLFSDSNIVTDDGVTDVDMGKLFSAKGQYQAFLKDNNAYSTLYKAIKYMGDYHGNRKQTISYIIHYLSDNNIKLNEKDNEIIKEYFYYDDFKLCNKYFLEKIEKNEITMPKYAFKLFAFLKLYINIKKDEIDSKMIGKLRIQIEKLNQEKLEHPWEQIFFTIGKYYKNDKIIYEKLLDIAAKICNKDDNGITLKLIGAMIKLNRYRNESEIKKFVEILSDSYISKEMKDYFKLEKLERKDISNEEKIELINSKFTYMYN